MKCIYKILYCWLICMMFIWGCSNTSDSNKTYTFTAVSEPAEGGSVIPASGTYADGQTVTFEAIPEDGWLFLHWGGDHSGTQNPDSLLVAGNMSISAVFEKKEYLLHIHVEGEGRIEEAVVAKKDASYPYQTVVQLTAIPEEGWYFSGWGGDLEGDENPAEITVDDEKSVTATFEKKEYELIITVEGEGDVEEKIIEAKALPYGTVVQLTASPHEGWRFESWSGDYEGTEPVYELTIIEETALTANFTRREYELVIDIEGQGTVQEEVVVAKSYPYETIVELTAIPEAEWEFYQWSGDLEGAANPVEIAIDKEKKVMAVFLPIAAPEVTTNKAGAVKSTSARAGGRIVFEGSATMDEWGVCYSEEEHPSLQDHCVISTQSPDHFEVTLEDLAPFTTYYARAFVKVGETTIYGNQISFTTIFDMAACGLDVPVYHQTSDGASPETTSVQYATVAYQGLCWITQNLGAARAAESADDNSANRAGWYWQFNRSQGYKNDGSSPQPGWNSNQINENRNWEEDKDPCYITFGKNWRLPSKTEWIQAAGWSPENASGAFRSPLKLHMAGILGSSAGDLSSRGTTGFFWSSSQENRARGQGLGIRDSEQNFSDTNKANGRSVRCVYSETPPEHLPNVEITNVKEEDGRIFIDVDIINQGTSQIQEKGVCYAENEGVNETDSCISSGSGSSDFTAELADLEEGITYYARAYARNQTGTALSGEVSFEGVSGPEPGEIISDIYTYALAAPDVTKEMYINWIDNSPAADGRQQTLRYGTGNSFDKNETATGRSIPHSDAYVYSVKLNNLNPDTRYSGRVHKNEHQFSGEFIFETLPVSISGSDEIIIAFTSDIHIDQTDSPGVPGNPDNSMRDPSRMRFIQQKNVRILNIAGDIVSNGYHVSSEKTEQYIGFFKDHIHTYLNKDQLVPLFVVPGNHEVGFAEREEGGFTEPTPDAGYFQLFFNNLKDQTNYNYGTTRAGNYLQLIGLDMFSSTPEQQKIFFENHASSSVSGVIPFMHSPMLEGGVRSAEDVAYSARIRQELAESFSNRENVYSYFTGHLHLKMRSKPWTVIEAASPPAQSLSLGNNKYIVVDESSSRVVEFGQGYRSNRTPYTAEDKTWYMDDTSGGDYNIFFTVTLRSGKHIVTEYNQDGDQIYSKDLRE